MRHQGVRLPHRPRGSIRAMFATHTSKLTSALLLVVVVLCAVMMASPSGASGGRVEVKVTADFASAIPTTSHPAVTYDPTLVPVGSRVQVTQLRPNRGGDAGNVLVETLRVRGLKSHARFYAYGYTHACGATPNVAGARVQDVPNSTHFSQNEIWLDFRTDTHGDAAASTSQYWLATGHAKSIIIDAHSNAEPVACVTIALK